MTGVAMAVALAVMAAASSPVPAWSEDVRLCKADAKRIRAGCKADCKEAFRARKHGCRKIDHECADACREAYHACRLPVLVDRDGEIAACDAALRDAKAICRSRFEDGSEERDRCVDQAQVVAFRCRDDAREEAQPELRRCRRTFRKCIRRACPPDVPVDRDAYAACKQDAKDLYVRCKAGCREAFQLDKDLCIDRDHACVEACRDTRATCRAPVVAVRDREIDACNATRDVDITTCKALYPRRSEPRDRCIDDAQVDAFRCRDAAREAVAPDLAACRDAFRACARECPPPGGSPAGAFVD